MPSLDFLLTALVVVLIPGTGVVYTLSVALFLGFRAGVWAALGCTLGILPHLLASILGCSSTPAPPTCSIWPGACGGRVAN